MTASICATVFGAECRLTDVADVMNIEAEPVTGPAHEELTVVAVGDHVVGRTRPVCIEQARIEHALREHCDSGVVRIDEAITRPECGQGGALRRQHDERLRFGKAGQVIEIAIVPERCVAREHTLAALESGARPYFSTYSSPSLLGILAMVEAGLAIAALAECSMPAHLVRLGKAEGLKPIAPLDIVLIKGRKNSSPAVECLAGEIASTLGG